MKKGDAASLTSDSDAESVTSSASSVPLIIPLAPDHQATFQQSCLGDSTKQKRGVSEDLVVTWTSDSIFLLDQEFNVLDLVTNDRERQRQRHSVVPPVEDFLRIHLPIGTTCYPKFILKLIGKNFGILASSKGKKNKIKNKKDFPG